MINVLLLISGTSIARLVPLVLGFLVARKLDGGQYALIVSFIMLANLITNFSSMGAVPQILSTKRSVKERQNYFFNIIFFGFFLLLLVSFFIYFSISVGIFSFSALPLNDFFLVVFYALGMLCLYYSTALCNSDGHNREAALVWFLYGFLSLSCVFIWYVCFESFIELIYLLVAVNFLIGLLSFFVVFFFQNEGAVSCRIDIKKILPILKDFFSLAFFGFLIVYGWYYLQSYLLEIDELIASKFSLYYQFYSIVLFLPAVIGNILVPKVTNSESSSIQYLLYYLIICFILVFPFCFFVDFIFDLYGIISDEVLIYEKVCFGLACVVSVVSSYLTQIFVSFRRFGLLLSSSGIWLFVLYVCVNSYTVNLTNIWFSVSVSYLTICMFLSLVYYASYLKCRK